MRQFILKLISFSIIFFFLSISGVIIPPTPRASRSLLFSKIDKDLLLSQTPTPRLILVGGSNFSFGINSQSIKEQLNVNPINTSIHASLGISYMLDSTLYYIKSSDVVIVSAEYSQYYGSWAYGGEELLRTVFDVSPETIKLLNRKQWLNIASFFPRFSFSKFKYSHYWLYEGDPADEVYRRDSFNSYGDVHVHYFKAPEKFDPTHPPMDVFNDDVIAELHSYQCKLNSMGANLLVTFPCLQARTFDLVRAQIARVESELKREGFLLLGTPERYRMPDEFMFNTPYHLNKEGADMRTRLLIEDFKRVQQQLSLSN